jgi:V/A-type H+-transporting ATPase subunit I
MLRPERMSKVSVTGSKQVMSEVIEAAHDLNVLHFSDYDESWEGFETGSPVEGAEWASDRLVTVRSLESILDVEAEDAGPSRIVTEEAIEEELEDIRREVNELDDRRDELRGELRGIEDRTEALEPFRDLGIDLDLLRDYDSVEVVVGEGDPEAVRDAVARISGVQNFEVMSGDDTVAVFAQLSEGADSDALADALVGVEFNELEVPDAEGDPEAAVADLEERRQQVESRLENVESELENLRREHAGFLLAAEEQLTITVQKAEAPLSFATTDRAFVAEGWVPTEEYATFVETLRDAVGDRVEIEELERADYTPTHGHEREAVSDGGYETGPHIDDSGPPVVQENPGAIKPFELLVETINRPRYFEVDPTVILFLTFPAFYGFMIGDLGYGILYAGIGYWLYGSFDSAAIRSLGGIAIWAGVFTALFGVLYGEIFGFHFIAEYLWHGVFGMDHAPMRKGLHTLSFARLWLTLSVLIGIVHLGVGYVFGFVNDSRAHGVREAVLEDVSWLLLMVGIWVWVFSTSLSGVKPAFLVGPESVFNGHPVALGFAGFSPLVGQIGLVVALVGFVLVAFGEGAEGLVETPTYGFAHILSYTRIAAVLLAKAGMAFVVNLLVFGAYEHHEEVHFMTGGYHVPEGAEVLFGGIFHAGVVGVLAGLVILLVGHTLVLALGVTSAGLQTVRLEYVEFFSKFYEGGGERYQPFGYSRTHTTED